MRFPAFFALVVLCLLAVIPPGARAVELITYVEGYGDHSDLYSIRPDGSGRRGVTRVRRARVFHDDPAISPDGRRVAFASNRHIRRPERGDYRAEIFTTAIDGSDLVRVTSSEAIEQAPSWSPDGRMLAFARVDDGAREIVVAGADGSAPRVVTPADQFADDPAWSPDGTLIAYTRHIVDIDADALTAEIWVVGAGGGTPRRITTGYDPAWSPHGNRLAFTDTPAGDGRLCDPLDCTEGADIFTVAADGSNRHLFLGGAGLDVGPTWSWDGSRIAFESDRHYPLGVTPEVHVAAAPGCEARLTALAHPASSPDWWSDMSPPPPGTPIPGICELPQARWVGPSLRSARRFKRFRLLWLGGEFRRQPLTDLERAHPAYLFRYDDCLDREADPAGRCGPPIELQVHNACTRHPLRIAGIPERRFRVGRALVTVRGPEGGYEVHTGQNTVTVYVDGLSRRSARRLVRALRTFPSESPERLRSPAFPPSMLATLRRTEALVRRHGIEGARRRLGRSRSAIRDRLKLARTIRRLPRARAADRRAAKRCDRRSRGR